MGSRTRYFFIGSALVVGVGLAVGVVAHYRGTVRGSGAGGAGLEYVPADVRAVGFVNVRDIMDSTFRQRLREAMPAGKGRDQLMAETGIDIEKDIDTLVAGIMGAGSDGGVVVILRGRFDQARIEKLATDHGATAEEYKAVRIIHGPSEVPAATGIAFLEPSVLAIGHSRGLKQAIDAAAAKAGVLTDDALMRTVAEIETSGNAWVVGRVAGLESATDNLPDQVKRHMDGLEWVAMSAAVGDTVRARVRAEAKDEKSAEDLRAVVGGAIAAGRMFAEQDTRFASAFKSIETTGRGRTVELVFTAPADFVDLMRLVPRPTPAAPPAPSAPTPPR